MSRPNFFIVGQPKAGTSAMHAFLEQHPDIFMARPKEPHFFCTDFHAATDAFHGPDARAFHEIRDERTYLGLFAGAGDAPVRGEASTNYLFSEVAARAIRAFAPEARILVMLREPVSFLAALHAQYVNVGTEDVADFAAALALEEERRAGRRIPPRVRCPTYLQYRRRVRYAEQIGRYLEVFPAAQVKVLIFEEFKADNEGTYAEVLRFLGVDERFRPDFRPVHDSRVPRSRVLNRAARAPAWRALAKGLLPARTYDGLQRRVQALLFERRPREPVPPGLAARLRLEFRPEVERAGSLLGRDLVSLWGYAGD